MRERISASGVRKDFLLRLTKSLRKQIEEMPEVVEARERHGEEVMPGKWVDVSMLCDLVESEVVLNENVPSVSQEDYLAQVVDPHHHELSELLTHIERLLDIAENASGLGPEEEKHIYEARNVLRIYDYER